MKTFSCFELEFSAFCKNINKDLFLDKIALSRTLPPTAPALFNVGSADASRNATNFLFDDRAFHRLGQAKFGFDDFDLGS